MSLARGWYCLSASKRETVCRMHMHASNVLIYTLISIHVSVRRFFLSPTYAPAARWLIMTHKNTCPRVIFGQKLDVKSTVGLVGGGVHIMGSIWEDVDSSSRAIRQTKNVLIHLTRVMEILENLGCPKLYSLMLWQIDQKGVGYGSLIFFIRTL